MLLPVISHWSFACGVIYFVSFRYAVIGHWLLITDYWILVSDEPLLAVRCYRYCYCHFLPASGILS